MEEFNSKSELERRIEEIKFMSERIERINDENDKKLREAEKLANFSDEKLDTSKGA